MTEEEAATKWCPHTRVYSSNGSYNSDGGLPHKYSTCMGSKCMAWRWVHDPLVKFVASEKTITDKTSEHGYCGLAGSL